MVLHCGFNLHFSDDDVEHLFICLLAICMPFFGELSIQVPCLFFNWIVCFFGVEFYKYFVNFGY